MIRHSAFRNESWRLHETELRLDVLAQTESLFALSNGHIGVRGNLDEGEPHGLPGTYLSGFYELRPLPYAEGGFGFPESGQTLINVTNGKLLRLLVDDEPFDVRYGTLLSHDRVLDFRTGTLTRCTEWTSPAHRTIRVRTTRLVSLTQRAVLAIRYEVEPLDGPVRLVLQSELAANEQLPQQSGDPRVSAALEAPLRLEHSWSHDDSAGMVHQTKRSGLRLAAAMDHMAVDGIAASVTGEESKDVSRVSFTGTLDKGQRFTIVKLVAYGWSLERTVPALRDQVVAAIEAARSSGWDGLLDEQRRYLDDFWERADVVVEGDPELQQAVRFALFHLLQASARVERRAIPAKGLTGTGYDGHSFWDTEIFVASVLTYMLPEAVSDVLAWRHSTLQIAEQRARELGLAGAAFPWRTIHGEECSAYWPAGTAAFHVNAAVANATIRYVHATGDSAFERTIGLDLIIATARLWRSLGHYDLRGSFRIDGVTGPDEYSALCDNDVYTNLMARRNLLGAAEACLRHRDQARARGISPEEIAQWRAAAERMYVPYDEMLGVHPQADGFIEHEVWDFQRTRSDHYPLFLHFPYFDLYRKQVVKQPDLVLAIQLCGDAFTPEQKARNFDYYEHITVRDSSLSACTEAAVAAEIGYMDLALDYVAEAALMDLEDIEHNARDGLHMASLAGAWIALVGGFGGMRDYTGELSFCPRLPARLAKLEFRLVRRGMRLRVEVRPDNATYSVTAEAPDAQTLAFRHHDERIELHPGETASRPIPAVPSRREPTQPSGREPKRRCRGGQ